ncbi:MAG: aminoacyl-tRNA hydrolase [Chlamydiales bacterium]
MSNIKEHCVIVGLGNPGPKYAKTRHNIGFMVVDAFADREKWSFKEEKRLKVFSAKGVVQSTQVHLVKPTTFMNGSGEAVNAYLNYYRLNAANLVVVVDDVALPFGEMRLREFGSTGGHNGLKSIEKYLKTTKYIRLRLGIHNNQAQLQDLADFVLDPFAQIEREQLREIIKQAEQALRDLMVEELNRVMSRVNSKRKPDLVIRQENNNEQK